MGLNSVSTCSLLVVYWSRNLVALDTMDFRVGQVGISLLATIIVIGCAWVVGVDRGIAKA